MEDRLRMSSEPQSLIPSLPEDIIIDILARVRRCYYPKLSLVSKHFRSLVTSHELYTRRSLLGCTEHCLYVVLRIRPNGTPLLYVLCQKANGNHSLVLVPSLPNMPFMGGFVSVGSMIYVFGTSSSYNHMKIPSNAISIDCRSQTLHLLPSMNVATKNVLVADIVDGKIYVTELCDKMVMAVFNIETQMWEPEKAVPGEMSGNTNLWPGDCVVMAGKMYRRDHNNSLVYVYDPKESKWETDKMMSMFKWEDACVVDDVLYYYDCGSEVLRAYDPKESSWVVVNGLQDLLAVASYSCWPYIRSYGGKLAMYFWKACSEKVISCAVISLERRQGKEIWGKVEWCDDVLLSDDFYFVKSLDVIV